MNIVEKEFNSMISALYGRNVSRIPENQLNDLRRSFYGGMITSLKIYCDARDLADENPDAGADLLNQMTAAIDEFQAAEDARLAKKVSLHS